jgi:anaphase-promoting complex subunit 1
MTASLSLAAKESPFCVGDSYFAKAEAINSSDSHAFDDNGSQMLKTIRALLQTSDPPNKIQGQILQTDPRGEGHEELVWTRSTIVRSVGGIIYRRWNFDDLDEEIQAVCWAWFEEKGTTRVPPAEKPLDGVFGTDPWKDLSSESMFGPYGRVMRASTSKSEYSANTIADPDYHGPGTGSLVRALCVFFRSFAYIYGDDGAEYRIDLPVCPRRAWSLFPVGVLLERRIPVNITNWNRPIYEHSATLYSLAAPLQSIVPVGIAHRILHSSHGLPAVYQEDKDVPNVDIFTNSEFRSFEHVLFIEESTPESHHIIFTIEKGLWIHCYLYAYRAPSDPASQHLMKGLVPEMDLGGVAAHAFNIPSPEFRPALTGHSSFVSTATTESLEILSQLDAFKQTPSWLKEATPPPPDWRNKYLSSTPLVTVEDIPPPPDFLSSNEDDPNDFDQPVHWFQKLDTCLIQQERCGIQNVIVVMKSSLIISVNHYEAIKIVTFDDSQLSRSFALWLPAERAYRVVHIHRTNWKQDQPKAGQATIADFAKDTYPALAIERVRATRPDTYDLLVLKPDHTLCLYANGHEYQLVLSVDLPSVKVESPAENISEGHPIPPTELKPKLLSIKDGAGSFFTAIFEGNYERRVSIDLLPRNRLVDDVLAALQYVLSSVQFAELRRNQLVRWCSRDRPMTLKKEIACLWEPLLEMVIGEGPGIISTQSQETSAFDSLASSAVHQKISNDRCLFNLQVPTAKVAPAVKKLLQGISSFCAPTLYALHILGQSLKVDLTRQAELEYLVPTILKIGNCIAPEWSDYWSRLFPDAEGAWSSIPLGMYTAEILRVTYF